MAARWCGSSPATSPATSVPAPRTRPTRGAPGRARPPRPTRVPPAPVPPGARLVLPWRADFNALAYVLSGSATAGAERRPVSAGQAVVFGAGEGLPGGHAGTAPLEVVLLGGEPLREPVVQYGPFVMNHRHELAQAV